MIFPTWRSVHVLRRRDSRAETLTHARVVAVSGISASCCWPSSLTEAVRPEDWRGSPCRRTRPGGQRPVAKSDLQGRRWTRPSLSFDLGDFTSYGGDAAMRFRVQ